MRALNDGLVNRATREVDTALEAAFRESLEQRQEYKKMIVSELARTAGVTPHAVRYYARIGLLRPNKDDSNNYRRFGRDDARRLTFIKKAQRLGFTLNEIAQLVEACERKAPSCPLVRDIVTRRIADTECEIANLSRLVRRMDRALQAWKELPDGIPDGETVCHLIESFADE